MLAAECGPSAVVGLGPHQSTHQIGHLTSHPVKKKEVALGGSAGTGGRGAVRLPIMGLRGGGAVSRLPASHISEAAPNPLRAAFIVLWLDLMASSASLTSS
jgi:hypothetical protein